MGLTKTGAKREAHHMTFFGVLFSSLTIPFPGGYLGHSMGVSDAPQNGALLSLGGISSSESQPGPVSVGLSNSEAKTSVLAFTPSQL